MSSGVCQTNWSGVYQLAAAAAATCFSTAASVGWRPSRSPCSGMSAKLPITGVDVVIVLRPQLSEQIRKRFDRIDFGCQVFVGPVLRIGIGNRLFRSGQVDP